MVRILILYNTEVVPEGKLDPVVVVRSLQRMWIQSHTMSPLVCSALSEQYWSSQWFLKVARLIANLDECCITLDAYHVTWEWRHSVAEDAI